MTKQVTMRFLYSFFLIVITISISSLNSTPYSIVGAQSIPIVSLNPKTINLTEVNQVFDVNLTVQNVQNVFQWATRVTWDSSVLNIVGNPTEGDFMTSSGFQTLFIAAPVNGSSLLCDNPNGTLPELSSTLLSGVLTGASGSGLLATLRFKIIKPTIESQITLLNNYLSSPEPDSGSPTGLKLIDHQTLSASVTLITDDIISEAGPDQCLDENTPMSFNGSKTMAPSNSTYTWTFEDNGAKNLDGITPNYTFDYPGEHKVTLTVRGDNKEASDYTTITVLDTTAPIARIALTDPSDVNSVYAKRTILFDASRSYDPENGEILSYQWGIDGTILSKNPEYTTATHEFPQEGTYNVTLTVTDKRANLTATDSLLLTVKPANAFPTNSGGQNESFTLPSTITASIIFITIITIVGSTFWLLDIKIKTLANRNLT